MNLNSNILFVIRSDEQSGLQFLFGTGRNKTLPDEYQQALVQSVKEVASRVFAAANQAGMGLTELRFLGEAESMFGTMKVKNAPLEKPWRKCTVGKKDNTQVASNIAFLLNKFEFLFKRYERGEIGKKQLYSQKADILGKLRKGQTLPIGLHIVSETYQADWEIFLKYRQASRKIITKERKEMLGESRISPEELLGALRSAAQFFERGIRWQCIPLSHEELACDERNAEFEADGRMNWWEVRGMTADESAAHILAMLKGLSAPEEREDPPLKRARQKPPTGPSDSPPEGFREPEQPITADIVLAQQA